jgi:hypothetical protein
MKMLIVCMWVVIALCFIRVAVAHAHYGNLWFQTRANMEENIEGKYQVYSVSCRKHPNAHWTQDNAFSLRRYDHFICGVNSEVTGRVCVAVAHQTGSRWSDIVLTGYHYARGTTCVPADLRRR